MAGLDEFALIERLTARQSRIGPNGESVSLVGSAQSASANGTNDVDADAAAGYDDVSLSGVVVGIGDDAAVVRVTPECELVLACDAMTEETHFRVETMRPEDVGYKALASNLSDLAAMGAVPKYALVSLTAPRGTSVEWLERMYDGLYECAARYGVAVVGGDTTSAPRGLVVAVTVTGEVEAGRALLRSGVRPGDAIFVTGQLGAPAAGLDYLLTRGENADSVAEDVTIPPDVRMFVQRHQRPDPRVEAGRILLASGVCHALNDISDGLASEANELAAASRCGILLNAQQIPLAEGLTKYAACRGENPLDWALYGGEEYELVGAAPESEVRRLSDALGQIGVPFTVIGTATDRFSGVRLRSADGEVTELSKRGYNHFA